MELSRIMKREHTRKKAKRPFRRTVYAVVVSIIAEYGLTEDFLKELQSIPPFPKGNSFLNGPLRSKRELKTVPFPLSDPAQFYLARKILERTENPYVGFACSPDEIVLSAPLFRANPGIRPDLLKKRHFESLLLAEIAKAKVAALHRVIDYRTAQGRLLAENADSVHSTVEQLQVQIAALKEFILFVENINEPGGETWVEN